MRRLAAGVNSSRAEAGRGLGSELVTWRRLTAGVNSSCAIIAIFVLLVSINSRTCSFVLLLLDCLHLYLHEVINNCHRVRIHQYSSRYIVNLHTINSIHVRNDVSTHIEYTTAILLKLINFAKYIV